MTHFWKRWRREYLAELRESHRYLLDKSQGKPKVVNGDIVLVHDEALPRGFWKLGRIQSVIVGVDGQARAATVNTVKKGCSIYPFWGVLSAVMPALPIGCIIKPDRVLGKVSQFTL